MPILSTLLLSALLRTQPDLEGQLEAALKANDQAALGAHFAAGRANPYLLRMAGRRGGLRNLQVDIMPAPKGWGGMSEQWAVFHTFQDIEQDHDVVIRVVDGKLTDEVPEYERGGWRIGHVRAEAELEPATQKVAVTSHIDLSERGDGTHALVMRLNTPYEISAVTVDGERRPVFEMEDGAMYRASTAGGALRCGGLLVIEQAEPIKQITVSYHGQLNRPDHDKISDKAAYVTAWWVPSVARLPHTTDVTVTGPENWELRSEGIAVHPQNPTAEAGLKTVRYRCDIPISFPKIIGGRYTLAAEIESNGKTFRAYHLDQVDRARAQRDVELMARAEKFFSENLSPYPFPSYECFDSDTYYGIESYSYTLLRREITTTFVTHELMHTWFGGIANSAYSRDTWNEGMTQYVDSVLFGENRDRTLETGYNTRRINSPLSEMNIAWENGSATYFRGAYVMHMLRRQIGPDKFWEGLRLLLKDRVGKDTVWADVRPYFEQASGQKLGWFWDQWINSGQFPTLDSQVSGSGPAYTVTVTQTGTPKPYRLVVGFRPKGKPEAEVILREVSSASETFTLEMDAEPELVLFPYALASTAN